MKSYEKRIKHDEFIGTKIGVVTITEFSHSAEGKGRLIYYYKYKCACGNDGISPKYSLLNTIIREKKQGRTTFCCEKCRKDKLAAWAKVAFVKYTDPVEGKCAILFSNYRAKCKMKNWEFLLTFDEFKKLVTSNCHYCNFPPNKCRKERCKSRMGISRIYFNGVDRIDSGQGYKNENCVPCCEDCNKGKRNLSRNQFLTMVKHIYEHLALNDFKDIE